MLLLKPGVLLKPAAGGMQIINALKSVSKILGKDLTITSGCDGIHNNPIAQHQEDPHYLGEAYDVRSHDMTPIMKQQFLAELNNLLPRIKFYYFLENPNLDIEHFHIQVRHDAVYTMQDLINA